LFNQYIVTNIAFHLDTVLKISEEWLPHMENIVYIGDR